MYNIVANAMLGDGCVHTPKTGKNPYLVFSSTSLDLLNAKRMMCIEHGIGVEVIRPKKQLGYGKKQMYEFRTNRHKSISEIAASGKCNVIMNLGKEDIALWFLDDGSLHKHKFFGHLYCNTLTSDELGVLIERIVALYGILPKERKDRKKDGREYPYLYYPVSLMTVMQPDIKKLIRCYGIVSLQYKIRETFND